MTGEEIERIKTVKRAHEDRWRAIEGVIAIGIGVTSLGKAGLIVSVKENAETVRALIPRQIEDIDVEVQETGEITAL